ncbi:2397_t:CDS:2, partial [Acaulospora colombiana]
MGIKEAEQEPQLRMQKLISLLYSLTQEHQETPGNDPPRPVILCYATGSQQDW